MNKRMAHNNDLIKRNKNKGKIFTIKSVVLAFRILKFILGTPEPDEELENENYSPEGLSKEDYRNTSARAKERTRQIIENSYRDFSVLGFGVYSFFYILEKLMILFVILTLFAYANMGLFYYYGDNKWSLNLFDLVEMGNLGYSSSYCKDVALGVGRMTLE